MPDIKIFPSLLSADFGRLQSEIDRFEPFVDGFHFDVMDGHFVPNLTMGAPILKCLRTKGVFDVHLMVENPENLIEDFVKAGAGMISFHAEAAGNNSLRLIKRIKSLQAKAGVVLKPRTSVASIEEVIHDIDFVLIMSVEPGYSGQKFMPEVLEKVKELRRRFPGLDIEIDGGVSGSTIAEVLQAGANMIVSASYLFGSDDPEKAVKTLRGES